jgi:hypothetical protein
VEVATRDGERGMATAAAEEEEEKEEEEEEKDPVAP